MDEIVACIKWVFSASEPGDDRFASLSPADEAALECALRHGEITGRPVRVITVGTAASERAARVATACGAAEATHLHTPVPLDSADVAAAIAASVPGVRWVWCGDYSLDRGTGSVPAFLAAQLHAPQALGLVNVDIGADGVQATRRLDGGRREVVSLARGVLSVEGSVATLRRAGLAATIAAGERAVHVVPVDGHPPATAVVRQYRPRARAIDTPRHADTLERLRQLTDAAAAPARGEVIALDPADAAERIVHQLAVWGYR